MRAGAGKFDVIAWLNGCWVSYFQHQSLLTAQRTNFVVLSRAAGSQPAYFTHLVLGWLNDFCVCMNR